MVPYDNRQTNDISKGNKKGGLASVLLLIVSIALFGWVVAATGYFYYASNQVESEITSVQQTISGYDTKIAELQTNRDIVALERVRANVPLIDKEVRASMAQNYLKELIQLGRKYTVYFTGFSYQTGKVTTAASAVSDSILAMDPIVKVSKLIREFRTTKDVVGATVTASTWSTAQPSASGSANLASDTFSLDPVGFIAGQNNKRAFSIELTVR